MRRRLELTEIAHADLKSIRRYSTRTWSQDRTSQYMTAIRDTLKGLVRGTVPTRNRDDLRPGLQMVASGRHHLFRADESRVLVVRVLHDRMDYSRHLEDSMLEEPIRLSLDDRLNALEFTLRYHRRLAVIRTAVRCFPKT